MNKLSVIVGTSGVGKTTLVKALYERGGFEIALEEHTERPFQALFKENPKYGIANQIDYLLFRAEQEQRLRRSDRPALMDGGLDLDFHGFTRLFHVRGWLNGNEFDLCRRLYSLTRSLLPPPDLVIAISASQQIIEERLASRDRINLASSEDAEMVHHFLGEWLDSLPEERILRLDVSDEGIDYSRSVRTILDRISRQAGARLP